MNPKVEKAIRALRVEVIYTVTPGLTSKTFSLAAATLLAFSVERYAGWYSTGSVLQSRECGLANKSRAPGATVCRYRECA